MAQWLAARKQYELYTVIMNFESKNKIWLFIFMLFFSRVSSASLPEQLYYAEQNSIKLKSPSIAEFAEEISVTIESVSKIATNAYINNVTFYVEHNLNCPIAHFNFPQGGIAEGIKLRIKLVYSTNVHALIEYSNGLTLTGKTFVKILRRGCEFCPEQAYNYPPEYYRGPTKQEQATIKALFQCPNR